MTRILVAGSRTFGDYATLCAVLRELIDNIAAEYFDLEIVSGMAPGADSLAAKFARAYHYALKEMPADWERYKKAAGMIRNNEMLRYIKEAESSIVVAFWDGESPGTRNMIQTSEAAGLTVYTYRTDLNQIL